MNARAQTPLACPAPLLEAGNFFTLYGCSYKLLRENPESLARIADAGGPWRARRWTEGRRASLGEAGRV